MTGFICIAATTYTGSWTFSVSNYFVGKPESCHSCLWLGACRGRAWLCLSETGGGLAADLKIILVHQWQSTSANIYSCSTGAFCRSSWLLFKACCTLFSSACCENSVWRPSLHSHTTMLFMKFLQTHFFLWHPHHAVTLPVIAPHACPLSPCATHLLNRRPPACMWLWIVCHRPALLPPVTMLRTLSLRLGPAPVPEQAPPPLSLAPGEGPAPPCPPLSTAPLIGTVWWIRDKNEHTNERERDREMDRRRDRRTDVQAGQQNNYQ